MRKKQRKPVTLCVHAGSTFSRLQPLHHELMAQANAMRDVARQNIINTLIEEYFQERIEVSPNTQTINIEIKLTVIPKPKEKLPF